MRSSGERRSHRKKHPHLSPPVGWSAVRGRKTICNPRPRRRLLLWGLGLILVAECGLALFSSPVLAVRRVRIAGLEGLPRGEVEATCRAAALPPHTSLLRVRADRMLARLNALPWVAQARISLRPPETLQVSILPREPVAILSTPRGRWETDAEGVLIRPAKTAKSLPEIALKETEPLAPGTSLDDPIVRGALSAALLRRGKIPIQVTKIEVDQNADICLNMQDNVRIRLGQVEDMPAKLALVRRIYERDPEIAAKVEAIDLCCLQAPACIPRTDNRTTPSSTASSSFDFRQKSAVGAQSGLRRDAPASLEGR